MRKDESAATAAAAALFVDPAEAEVEAADQGAEEADQQGATDEVEEEDFPNFEVELPEDFLSELGLDEPEEEDVVAELESEEEYQLLDDEGKRLLARARSAERKAEHYEKLRLQEAAKNWKTEAEKFFPLSAPFLGEITATSRKGYLREAKARHEAVLPLVKPITEQARKVIEQEKEKAKAEGRAEAEKAWGRAGTGTTTPTDAAITQDEITRNRAKGDLTSTIKSMIFSKEKS